MSRKTNYWQKTISLSFALFVMVIIFNGKAFSIYAESNDLVAAQKEVSQLASKKNSLLKKMEKAEKELEDAQLKMDSKNDKPNSLAYKKAAKKAEEAQGDITQLDNDIQSIDARIDYLNNFIKNEQDKIDALNERSVSNEDMADKNEDKAEVQVNDYEEQVANTNSEAQNGVDTKASSSSKSDDDSSDGGHIGLIIFLCITLYIVYKIRKWLKKNQCPHCKKKFAMRVVDEDNLGEVRKEIVKNKGGGTSHVRYYRIRVTRECKYCHYEDEHEEIRSY